MDASDLTVERTHTREQHILDATVASRDRILSPSSRCRTLSHHLRCPRPASSRCFLMPSSPRRTGTRLLPTIRCTIELSAFGTSSRHHRPGSGAPNPTRLASPLPAFSRHLLARRAEAAAPAPQSCCYLTVPRLVISRPAREAALAKEIRFAKRLDLSASFPTRGRLCLSNCERQALPRMAKVRGRGASALDTHLAHRRPARPRLYR